MGPVFPRAAHVFVDETKAHDYIMVATWVAPVDLAPVRKALRSLVPSGRHRVHFKKLTDAQRDDVVRCLNVLPLNCFVVRVRGVADPDARRMALCAVLVDASAHGAARVVIEADEPSVVADREVARREFIDLPVQHLRHAEDPVLWASDAIAWCLQRRGGWPAKVSALIRRERRLE